MGTRAGGGRKPIFQQRRGGGGGHLSPQLILDMLLQRWPPVLPCMLLRNTTFLVHWSICSASAVLVVCIQCVLPGRFTRYMWNRQKTQMKGTDSVAHSTRTTIQGKCLYFSLCAMCIALYWNFERHCVVWYTQYTHKSGEMFVKVKYLCHASLQPVWRRFHSGHLAYNLHPLRESLLLPCLAAPAALHQISPWVGQS